ncbi:TPA: hypothetical protein N0F65_006350 [Lagenidium giganteum]|uniref:Uncharacterized protein n=1 Tax=Lagenidium giganteum TaxID=4803 RepID=A0AAV2YGA4_9STRA|nr:TPA: hypothetical protein N0F65_006350 [Lagenidium giganteum]
MPVTVLLPRPQQQSASGTSLQAGMNDGYVTPPLREFPKEYAKYEVHRAENDNLLSPSTSKRKSKHDPACGSGSDSELMPPMKRKASSDYLRKGQWTSTEERLARLLIEAFEEGYLPIYTGIRLRGYLAIQLQCDPMRVSKKLCAGVIDGKRIPKNYGQKKFKLRKKHMWDREEAGRILATLEQLTKEMWNETGTSPPAYLSLSSTRNCHEDDDTATRLHMANLLAVDLPQQDATPPSAGSHDSTASSPVKKLSPHNKSNDHRQQKNVMFPIIYLNLSKKMKNNNGSPVVKGQRGSYVQSPATGSDDEGMHDNGALSSSSSPSQRYIVDVESYQAAQELIELHYRQCQSPEELGPPSDREQVGDDGH